MFCKVAHNDVGAVLAKNLRVVAPGYAYDKTEAAFREHPFAVSMATARTGSPIDRRPPLP
jgi:hypothetical protein